MSNKPQTLKLDDVEYIRADQAPVLAEEVAGFRYCVVRTYSAGVHIGYVETFGSDNNPQYAKLLKSRRLHYWNKAASLSQVAMEGVGTESRIAMEIPEIELTDVIEVIPCSEFAADFFQKAQAWKK